METCLTSRWVRFSGSCVPMYFPVRREWKLCSQFSGHSGKFSRFPCTFPFVGNGNTISVPVSRSLKGIVPMYFPVRREWKPQMESPEVCAYCKVPMYFPVRREWKPASTMSTKIFIVFSFPCTFPFVGNGNFA